MNKYLLIIFALSLFFTACVKRYDTYSQSEFQSLVVADGYKYTARAQLPSTITAEGVGDHIMIGVMGAGAHTDSQKLANEMAMSDCAPQCIISLINGQITTEAQEYIDIAKAKIEEERIKNEIKEEEERIKNEIKEKEFIASIPKLSNYQLCDTIIDKSGKIKYRHANIGPLANERLSRNLSVEDCNMITGNFTAEQKKVISQIEKEQKAKKIKQQKISVMKTDCEDLGFKDGTEAMGNCVLKLMELENKSSPTNITTTSSSTSNEIVDIEKQKLQAQREALKLQKDQLKAEQERVAQERRKAQKKAADKSIQQGFCLMNGGGWGCGY